MHSDTYTAQSLRGCPWRFASLRFCLARVSSSSVRGHSRFRSARGSASPPAAGARCGMYSRRRRAVVAHPIRLRKAATLAAVAFCAFASGAASFCAVAYEPTSTSAAVVHVHGRASTKHTPDLHAGGRSCHEVCCDVNVVESDEGACTLIRWRAQLKGFPVLICMLLSLQRAVHQRPNVRRYTPHTVSACSFRSAVLGKVVPSCRQVGKLASELSVVFSCSDRFSVSRPVAF